MSEFGWRLTLVLLMLAVAGIVILVMRSRDAAPSRGLGRVALEPGVYLFSSSTCLDCGPARKKLSSRLGHGGFTEIEWESQPEVFDRLGIDRVPVAVRVDSKGQARLYKGDLGPMFSSVDP